jgi:hypothetical protein
VPGPVGLVLMRRMPRARDGFSPIDAALAKPMDFRIAPD